MSTAKTITDLLMNRDKIYVLPTRFGFAFSFINLAILMSAATYANNLAYLLAFTLFSVLMLSLIQTHFNFKAIALADVIVEGGHAEQAMKINITLKNTSHFDCQLITCQAMFSELKSKYTSESMTIKANDSSFIQILVPVEKRGLYHLKGIQLSSVFPLGLWRTWKSQKIPRNAYAYPKIAGSQEFPQPLASMRSQNTLERAGGDDFSGLRTYISGDSMRHVDWKAHARTGNMYIKKFEDGGEATYDFNWFDIRSQNPETCLSQLTSWMIEATQKQEAFALTLPTRHIEADKGPTHLKNCLEILAVYEGHSEQRA